MALSHGPSEYTSAAVGPADQRPLPNSELLAVGNWKIGPAPQTQVEFLAGERKKESCVSSSPDCSCGVGEYATVRLGRANRSQSAFSENGSNGSMFTSSPAL